MIRQNKAVRHLCYWCAAFVVTYLFVLAVEIPSLAFEVACIIILPAPLPVYIHFFAFHKLFERRKYFLYFIALIAILVLSGFGAEYVYQLITDSPNSHTGAVGTALFFIILTTGFKYYTQGVKQQYLLQEAEAKQARSELAQLKAQLHPHFLFNTLNNLYALSLEDSRKLPEMILKLSELMRYILESAQKAMHPLTEEIRFIENYVELEKLRLSKSHNIQLSVQGRLDGQEIAPLLLMPFVENAFKHGGSVSGSGGFIHIQAEMRESEFVFQIENGVLPKPGNDKNKSNGIGLANVKRRLAILYPKKHSLVIHDDGKTYRSELSLMP